MLVFEGKGPFKFHRGCHQLIKKPAKNQNNLLLTKSINDINSDTQKIFEESWISVIVCDIVKILSGDQKNCPKINLASHHCGSFSCVRSGGFCTWPRSHTPQPRTRTVSRQCE